MSEHYDFHYQPTGSGAISGQQVLQQTEDAINELGDYVNNNVGGAMDVAQQALETAQNAEQDAQTALDTANSFSSAIQSAQQDASTALSTAQTAQTTASNANNTAIQAQQDASSAVTTANNASGQVNTLSGTVTALGQRVTTAEGNIGQNTSDITALTTRVGTAEGNITTLQNDVSIAMGNASSAMATAGTVKQQAYVFRYSSTALVASSTNSNTLLDNTDNLKVGDKVIDSSGVLFSVTAIDTANSTFTIGTALVDLAQDSDVVHKSGDETVGGQKTFTNSIILQNSDTSGLGRDLFCKSQVAVLGAAAIGDNTKYRFVDKNNNEICYIRQRKLTNSNTDMSFCVNNIDNDNNSISAEINFIIDRNNDPRISPSVTDFISLGRPTFRWKNIYSNSYYYGNVEFSTKFVTTDTAQTITHPKTFTASPSFTGYEAIRIYSPNDEVDVLPSTSQIREIRFTDKNNVLISYFTFQHRASSDEPFRTCWRQQKVDGTSSYYSVNFNNLGEFYPENDNVKLGTSTNRWSDCQTKLINGLTPSSLSLPSGNVSDFIDISSYITDMSGNTANSYTAPANGWISIAVIGTAIAIVSSSRSDSRLRASSGDVRMLYPVLKNETLDISVMGTTLAYARFIPCQGNV